MKIKLIYNIMYFNYYIIYNDLKKVIIQIFKNYNQTIIFYQIINLGLNILKTK